MGNTLRVIKLAIVLLCFAVALGGSPVRAEGLLDKVPRDSAGFVYLRNLKAVDDKLFAIVAPSLGTLGSIPIVITPGVVLQVVVGKDVALDTNGDVLIVAAGSDQPLDRAHIYAWLPVADYGRFVQALGGKADEPITVVTISGEDVLCADDGRWAVVVDPTQRKQLEALLTGEPQLPELVAANGQWLNAQDVSAAVFPTAATRAALGNWLKADVPQADVPAFDELFGPARSQNGDAPAGELFSQLRRALQRFLLDSPQLSALALDADAAMLGVRVDAAGNALAGLRMSSQKPSWAQVAATALQPPSGAAASLPDLHPSGEFTVSASGFLPKTLLVAVVDSALRNAVTGERSEPRPPRLDPQAVERFIRTGGAAAQEVLGVGLAHAPGGPEVGVYTNQFAVVRVKSADIFSERFAAAMQAWNEVSQKATPPTRVDFQSENVTLAGRRGTRYSLDVAASVGGDDSPDLRRSLERMFGSDRKLNLFVVPFDPSTVLVAEATAEQTTAKLNELGGGGPANWEAPNVRETNRLLPRGATWRLFVSLGGYTKWRRQELMAMAGDDVFGLPTSGFPAAPPLGLAGGFTDGALWIDAAVPAATIRAAGEYFRKQQ